MFVVVHHFLLEPGCLKEAILLFKKLNLLYFPFLERVLFIQGVYNSLVLHSFWRNQEEWDKIKTNPPEEAEGLMQKIQSICFQASILHMGNVLDEQKGEIQERMKQEQDRKENEKENE